jgi:hypothetical protein
MHKSGDYCFKLRPSMNEKYIKMYIIAKIHFLVKESFLSTVVGLHFPDKMTGGIQDAKRCKSLPLTLLYM